MMRKPNQLPISQLPLLAATIAGILENTEEQLQQFNEIRDKPHVLDDATVQRAQRLYRVQLQDMDLYENQTDIWLAENPTSSQQTMLDKMLMQIGQIRGQSQIILDLLAEIETGTIDRIMAMSDEEVGLYHLKRQAKRKNKKSKKPTNMQQRKKSDMPSPHEPTRKHHQLAQNIHQWVTSTQDENDLLVNMIDYMPLFKTVMDTATQQQMDVLCEQYGGFYHFGMLLENLARGIRNGDIEVPKD
jgi:hypothetical protein